MKTQKIQQYSKPFRILLCAFLLMTVVCTVTACGNQVQVPTYDEEEEPAQDLSVLAMVCNIDDVNEKITIKELGSEDEKELSYTGGADVKDAYDQVITMTQVQLGSLVSLVYDANKDKVVSVCLSNKDSVQQLTGVEGAVVDPLKNTIQANGATYYMNPSVCAFSDNTEIGLDEICSEDKITLWLYNNMVYSIYVELGHGYVRLSDYASYIGGMVEIGYDVIVPVTEDMLLTVREGTYTLRIAKGEDSGTKEVKVVKNQETDLSLADIAIEPKETGSILFKVTPSDAAVYIDKRRVNTEGAVEVTFGKHKIDIIADGYESYSASFNVNYAYKIKEYTLQKEEEGSTENASTSTTVTTQGSTSEMSTQAVTTESSTTAENSTAPENSVKDVASAEGTKTNNKVTVSAPTGASVYFDGEYLGIAPISFTKVTGSHIITLSQSGFLSKSYTVNFTDDGKDVPLQYDELISITSLIE